MKGENRVHINNETNSSEPILNLTRKLASKIVLMWKNNCWKINKCVNYFIKLVLDETIVFDIIYVWILRKLDGHNLHQILNKLLFSKENIYIFKLLKFNIFLFLYTELFFLKRFIKFRNAYDHPTCRHLGWLLLTRLDINSINFLFDKMIELFNKLIVVIFVNKYRA